MHNWPQWRCVEILDDHGEIDCQLCPHAPRQRLLQQLVERVRFDVLCHETNLVVVATIFVKTAAIERRNVPMSQVRQQIELAFQLLHAVPSLCLARLLRFRLHTAIEQDTLKFTGKNTTFSSSFYAIIVIIIINSKRTRARYGFLTLYNLLLFAGHVARQTSLFQPCANGVVST